MVDHNLSLHDSEGSGKGCFVCLQRRKNILPQIVCFTESVGQRQVCNAPSLRHVFQLADDVFKAKGLSNGLGPACF
jgi:hypothetical protein